MKPVHNSHHSQMRNKLIGCGALYILAFFFIGGTLLANLNNVTREYESVSAVCADLQAGNALVQDAQQLLSELISAPAEVHAAEFSERLCNVKRYYAELELPLWDYETFYMYRDILQMLNAYEEKSTRLLQGGAADLGAAFARLEGMALNIRHKNEALTARLYSQSGVLSQSISRQIFLFNICLPSFSVFIVAYSIVILSYLNQSFVSPLRKLTGVAQGISRGEFPKEALKFAQDDELNLLSETMFNMGVTIQENIEEISQRARLAQELNHQQIENLRIKSMYDQLELHRLQEQINPHFLFNCLSTLHHTAYLEGADRTCEISSAIASLLRYNFRQASATVTLTQELDVLRKYIYLQGIRFGDRIRVQMDVDADISNVSMPRMVLQPIVENCYSHGCGDLVRAGEIQIGVRRAADCVKVCVRDNGKGIPKEKLEQMRAMFAGADAETAGNGHIGMMNVVRRLQNFYGRRDVIELENRDGLCVTLCLFLERREKV